jgi:hypothetical protein
MPPFFWTQKQDIGPSSRTNHGLAYDGARQRVLLFGGDPGGPPLSDTWSWDGALWTQVADTGPSARHSLTIAFDGARQRVLLFGGASGAVLFADTWTWDGTEWTQVADTGPSARGGHALAYDSARARVVLFGGRTAANPLGDTWEWDGTEWTQVQDVGPSGRCAHAMAFDPTASRVVLFGGAGANGTGLNDTWLWDGADWTQATNTGPDPRAAFAMVAGTTIVLFGGVNSIDPGFPSANRIIYGDSWRWDGNAWTKVQDIGPAPRWGHGMAFRSDAGRILLVGGSSVFGHGQDASLQAGVMRDTWEHPEVADQTASGGVEVANVAVIPDFVTNMGDVMDVTVTLTQPAPAGGATLDVIVAILDPADGFYHPIDPTGFTFPQPIMVAAGDSSPQFQMVRDAQPLTSGDYLIGIQVEGGAVMEVASFVIN